MYLTQLPALAAMHFLMSPLDGLQLPSARPRQQASPSKQHGRRLKQVISGYPLQVFVACTKIQSPVIKQEDTYTTLGSKSPCRESNVQHARAVHCLEGSRGCSRTPLYYHIASLESFHQVLSSCQDIQDRTTVTE